MAAKSYTLTAGGYMRAPPINTQSHWVKEAWEAVKVPTIVKAFKKCCISNAMDGTEDDILWQHEVNDTIEPDVDEQAEPEEEPTDPHDDEIQQDEYQALFFGDHANDSDNDIDGGSDNDS